MFVFAKWVSFGGDQFSNMLLSVVLKRLLAVHLVIYSPSVGFGDTVTRLLLSMELGVYAGLDFYWLQVFDRTLYFALLFVKCDAIVSFGERTGACVVALMASCGMFTEISVNPQTHSHKYTHSVVADDVILLNA